MTAQIANVYKMCQPSCKQPCVMASGDTMLLKALCIKPPPVVPSHFFPHASIQDT